MNQIGPLWVISPDKTVLPYNTRGNIRVHHLAHTHKNSLCFCFCFLLFRLLFFMSIIALQLLPKYVMCVNLRDDRLIRANLWCGQVFFWMTEEKLCILCSGFLWPRMSYFSPCTTYLKKIGGEKKVLLFDSPEYILTDQICLQLKYPLWE